MKAGGNATAGDWHHLEASSFTWVVVGAGCQLRLRLAASQNAYVGPLHVASLLGLFASPHSLAMALGRKSK